MVKSNDFVFDSRKYIAACRDAVGDSFLMEVFHVSLDMIRRYCAERGFVSEDYLRENPIEKYERTLRRMAKTPGAERSARAMVARHAHMVGCELVDIVSVQPTAKDLSLADVKAIKEFGEFISAYSAAIATGTITPDNQERIAKEGHEALEAILYILKLSRKSPSGS